MKRAVIYARYSSDNQREESISAQIFECEDYAKKNGLLIVKIYKDEAKSATTDDRPNFISMIKEAETGLFDVVIVHKFDRFARNRFDSAFYKKKLKHNQIKLISVTQPLDDSPESQMLEGFLEVMDEYYSKDLAREAMKGLKENARNCLFNGGTPPLGYDVDPETKRYIINEDEAFIVNKVYELYDSGLGYDKIVNHLKAIGCKTKRGGNFSKNSLYGILTNERYTGEFIYNQRTSKFNGKRNNNLHKNESEIIKIPDGMPRIINQDLWDRVQAKFIERKHEGNRARLKAKVSYLLSGKVHCGNCGSSMVGNTINSKKPYSYYECNARDRKHSCNTKRIKKEQIELIVIKQIETEIFNNIPSLLTTINQKIKERFESSNKEASFLEKEIEETSRKINNIIKAIEEGAFSKILADQLNNHESKMSELSKKLRETKNNKKTVTISEEMLTDYIEEAKSK